ncbi:hypothetical protein D5085_14100 [Ectothiorhodospiraceae bacterium BW-2]|nr:hypothetical protein D5085_14100 [Ectothiorhodospiraceae bacterium BW-2]
MSENTILFGLLIIIVMLAIVIKYLREAMATRYGYASAKPGRAHPVKRLRADDEHHSSTTATTAAAVTGVTAAVAFAAMESDDYMSDETVINDSGIEINPANGLPMVDGVGSVDIEGNPYGFDSSFSDSDSDSGSDISGFDDTFSSSSDDW